MARRRLQPCACWVVWVQLCMAVLSQECSNTKLSPNYEDVFKPELERSHGAFLDLPGFTRSRCASAVVACPWPAETITAA